MSNTVGGNIETKEIGLRISDSGTYENTEILNGKLVLSKVDEITYYKEGSWTSDVIDLADNFAEFGKLFATYDDTNNASIAILTRTSNDGITFDEWIAVGEDGSILSNKQQYIQVKINLFAGYVNQEVVISEFKDVSEKEKFTPNEYINTQDGLKLERNYVRDMEVDESWTDEGDLYRLHVDRNEWSRVDGIKVLPSEVESKTLFVDETGSHKYIDIDYDSPIPPLEIPSLTNYFTFDEPSGNVLDSKGSVVGTINGATRIDNEFKGLSFDGIDDVVAFNSSLLNSSTSEFAVRYKGILFKSSTSAFATITLNGSGIDFRLTNDGHIRVAYIYNNTMPVSIFIEGDFDGVYKDYLIVFKDSTFFIYINNELVATHVSSFSEIHHTGVFLVGRNFSTSYYSKLIIDELAVFDKGITPYDLYESRKWESELNIQNGSTDKLPKRQLTQLPPIPMSIKSGILSEDDTGVLHSTTLDLNKYSDIHSITSDKSIVMYKDGKFYSQMANRIDYSTLMTSDTSPSPLKASASSINDIKYYAYKAFDGIKTGNYCEWQAINGDINPYIQIDFGEIKRVNKITLTAPYGSSVNVITMIKEGKLLGSVNGVNFTDIFNLNITNQWSESESRTFYFDKAVEFSIYRLVVNKTFGNNEGGASGIAEIEFGLYENYWIESDEISIDASNNIDVKMDSNYFYETFGNSVEVLYYDETGNAPQPSLTITANWSPLDELEGDFEVVALANDEIPRQLKLEAIPHPQFIHLVENVNISEIQNFTTIESSYDTIRFLINKDNTWYTFSNNQFVQVDVNELEIIKSQGITTTQLNNIGGYWSLFDTDTINVGIYLEDDIRDNYISQLNKLSISGYLPVNTKEISKSSFYILNTTARIDVTLEGTILRAILSDADLGRVQYRVLLNGQPYRHSETNEEGWNELSPSPYNINMNLYDVNIIIPNANNTVRIEFRDAFGTEDYWESIFYAKKIADKFTYAFIM